MNKRCKILALFSAMMIFGSMVGCDLPFGQNSAEQQESSVNSEIAQTESIASAESEVSEAEAICTISGTVKDENNELLSDVRVTLVDGNKQTVATTISKSNGEYKMTTTYDSPSGYTLRFEKEHYKVQIHNVSELVENYSVDTILESDGTLEQKKYAPYAEVLEQLMKEHGSFSTKEDSSDQRKESTVYQLRGVCYAELLDFDNDGSEELLCAWYDETNQYSSPRYIVNVYRLQDNQAIRVYDGHAASFYNPDPALFLLYYQEGDKILLNTKKNPMSFTIDHWSELQGNEFKVVKTFSDMPNKTDIANHTTDICRIDDKIVSRETFDNELKNIKDQWTAIRLSALYKDEAQKNAEAMNETLEKIGCSGKIDTDTLNYIDDES